MRINEFGRKIAFEKLMKPVTGDWKTSKLGFAISRVWTYIYDKIHACLIRLEQSIILERVSLH